MSKQRIRKIKRYLNPVAQQHVIATAPYKTLLAGRGFSKSFTNGIKQARKLDLMPQSVGLFNSPTYSMIYTKTLIPMKAAWEQHMGYIEGIHYVVGKAPPKYFAKPWHKPHRYENVVTFWNGRTIIFGSFDRPALISGGSYDDVDTDEAYMIDKEDYDNFVIPTVRGTHPSFKEIPGHLQQTFTSSMPFRNQGDFLLDYYQKALSNPGMYHFIGWEPNAKVQLGSTFMNREVLGMKAIDQMLAEMDEISARIMIHNQKISSYGNVFYPDLTAKNLYLPRYGDNILPLGMEEKKSAANETDYNPEMPLHISHDWGKFNCITIDQEYPKEVRVINSMHVFNGGQHPKDQDDLADAFDDYYRGNKVKIVYQWGDKSGNNALGNSKLTYFEQFAERLRDKGWRVIRKKTGDVEQLERFRFCNLLLKGDNKNLPRVTINKNNCTDLIIALESARMKGDKKDKSSEQNPSIKPEHATHYTDAFDYRMYHGFIKREKGGASIDPYSISLG